MDGVCVDRLEGATIVVPKAESLEVKPMDRTLVEKAVGTTLNPVPVGNGASAVVGVRTGKVVVVDSIAAVEPAKAAEDIVEVAQGLLLRVCLCLCFLLWAWLCGLVKVESPANGVAKVLPGFGPLPSNATKGRAMTGAAAIAARVSWKNFMLA